MAEEAGAADVIGSGRARAESSAEDDDALGAAGVTTGEDMCMRPGKSMVLTPTLLLGV
jgi:hypothetical protein